MGKRYGGHPSFTRAADFASPRSWSLWRLRAEKPGRNIGRCPSGQAGPPVISTPPPAMDRALDERFAFAAGLPAVGPVLPVLARRLLLEGLCGASRQGLDGIRLFRPRAHADLGRDGPPRGPGEDDDPLLPLRRPGFRHRVRPLPRGGDDGPDRPRTRREHAGLRPELGERSGRIFLPTWGPSPRISSSAAISSPCT